MIYLFNIFTKKKYSDYPKATDEDLSRAMDELPDKEFKRKVNKAVSLYEKDKNKQKKTRKTIRQTKEAKESRKEFNIYTRARIVSYKLLDERLKNVEKKIDQILELVSVVR